MKKKFDSSYYTLFNKPVNSVEFETHTSEIITISYDDGSIKRFRLFSNTDKNYSGKVKVIVVDKVADFGQFELKEY